VLTEDFRGRAHQCFCEYRMAAGVELHHFGCMIRLGGRKLR
jgi:hypothetical protein